MIDTMIITIKMHATMATTALMTKMATKTMLTRE